MFTSFPVVFLRLAYYNRNNWLCYHKGVLDAVTARTCTVRRWNENVKKSTFISILALLIAAIGAVVAFLAYFSKRKCVLCDDFDDFEEDMSGEEPGDISYYAAEMDTIGAEEAEPSEAPHEEASKEEHHAPAPSQEDEDEE